MKKYNIQGILPVCLLVLLIFLPSGLAKAADLSFLSFESPEMINFDLSFKQYFASYKQDIEEEKGQAMLAEAREKWAVIYEKARGQGAGDVVLGRMSVIQGLLVQAQGLAGQGRFDEAGELSVPLRSEIFELHRALNMLTSEDFMIYFHNGVMHRAEPLIKQKRYMELALLIPRIQNMVFKFKEPPGSVTDLQQYRQRYDVLLKKVMVYIDTIRLVNEYVDQEYASYMLSKQLEEAHAQAHAAFGALYLSFPEGMVWPKNK